MKVTVHEFKQSFAVQITSPDTVKEAAVVTRFGMLATKDIRFVGTSLTDNGEYELWIELGKARKYSSRIQRKVR